MSPVQFDDCSHRFAIKTPRTAQTTVLYAQQCRQCKRANGCAIDCRNMRPPMNVGHHPRNICPRTSRTFVPRPETRVHPVSKTHWATRWRHLLLECASSLASSQLNPMSFESLRIMSCQFSGDFLVSCSCCWGSSLKLVSVFCSPSSLSRARAICTPYRTLKGLNPNRCLTQ